jgi:hypothetical protein
MTCWPFATSCAWTAIGLILFTRRDRSADWGSPESMISKADRKRARRGERNLNSCATDCTRVQSRINEFDPGQCAVLHRAERRSALLLDEPPLTSARWLEFLQRFDPRHAGHPENPFAIF